MVAADLLARRRPALQGQNSASHAPAQLSALPPPCAPSSPSPPSSSSSDRSGSRGMFLCRSSCRRAAASSARACSRPSSATTATAADPPCSRSIARTTRPSSATSASRRVCLPALPLGPALPLLEASQNSSTKQRQATAQQQRVTAFSMGPCPSQPSFLVKVDFYWHSEKTLRIRRAHVRAAAAGYGGQIVDLSSGVARLNSATNGR